MPIFSYHYDINILPKGKLAKRRETISLIKSRSRQERSSQLPFEKSCLLFFAHEKGLGHMFQK